MSALGSAPAEVRPRNSCGDMSTSVNPTAEAATFAVRASLDCVSRRRFGSWPLARSVTPDSAAATFSVRIKAWADAVYSGV